jgi:4-aminobutyrate aminotransferase-like enzyme
MGTYILSELQKVKKKHAVIADVRGRGLLIAIEFNKDIAEAVMYGCLAKGFMINHLKANTLRVIPPLIITKAEADEGIRKLDEVLTEMKV